MASVPAPCSGLCIHGMWWPSYPIDVVASIFTPCCDLHIHCTVCGGPSISSSCSCHGILSRGGLHIHSVRWPPYHPMYWPLCPPCGALLSTLCGGLFTIKDTDAKFWRISWMSGLLFCSDSWHFNTFQYPRRTFQTFPTFTEEFCLFIPSQAVRFSTTLQHG